MKPIRSTQTGKAAPAPMTVPGEGPYQAWLNFWFTPIDPVGFHVLRVLTGLLFLAWLLPFHGSVDSLFGLQGWFDQRALAEAAQMEGGAPKPIRWSILYLSGTNPATLTALYWLSIAVLALFTAGVWTRLTAILTWIVVVSFTVNPALDPDADALLVLLATYMMVGYGLLGPVRPTQGLAGRILGSTPIWPWSRFAANIWADRTPRVAANLALRLVQVHFAIVMVVTGLHKLQFGEWWSGVALWYPLHPPMETTFADVRAIAGNEESYFFFLSLACYAIMTWEIGFPLFAWKRRLRLVLVGGAFAGWMGYMFLYRQPTVGPALFLFALSYLEPEEWRRLLSRMARLPGLNLIHSEAGAAQIESAGSTRKLDQGASLVSTGQSA